MSISIVPTAERYFEGLHNALDCVAREKRFLALTQAPPIEEAVAFFRNIVANDYCQFVALQDDEVVGWCDVLSAYDESRAHVGTLGIGLVPGARHLGIGATLMAVAISKARDKGISRIELTVRTDNVNARALYERFGFVVEGTNRRAFLVDGEYFDAYAMALLLSGQALQFV